MNKFYIILIMLLTSTAAHSQDGADILKKALALYQSTPSIYCKGKLTSMTEAHASVISNDAFSRNSEHSGEMEFEMRFERPNLIRADWTIIRPKYENGTQWSLYTKDSEYYIYHSSQPDLLKKHSNFKDAILYSRHLSGNFTDIMATLLLDKELFANPANISLDKEESYYGREYVWIGVPLVDGQLEYKFCIDKEAYTIYKIEIKTSVPTSASKKRQMSRNPKERIEEESFHNTLQILEFAETNFQNGMDSFGFDRTLE